MRVTIPPAQVLSGSVRAIPSKSSLQRLLFAAACARGESRIGPRMDSQDVLAALDAVRSLGASVEESNDCYIVRGRGALPPGGSADVRESGSVLRFMIPLLLTGSADVRVEGRPGLAARTLSVYDGLFSGRVARWVHPEGKSLPLDLRGPLAPGAFRVRGDVSSQFITGLLYALPLLDGDSRIVLESPLESAPYVGMTLQVLERAGIGVMPLEPGTEAPHGGWAVPGRQAYEPLEARAEGDWSGAAFWLAAADLQARRGGPALSIEGLDPESLQSDRYFARILSERPAEVDLRECPDLLPVLSAWAGLSGAPLSIRGAARVRLKECDRVAAMAQELTALGGRVRELPDGLDIEPVDAYAGGRVSSWNDHRLVMALTLAALGSRGSVTVDDAGAVAKSWPSFFDEFRAAGGSCDVQHDR